MGTTTAGLVIKRVLCLSLVVIELYDLGKFLYSFSYLVKFLAKFQATSDFLWESCLYFSVLDESTGTPPCLGAAFYDELSSLLRY